MCHDRRQLAQGGTFTQQRVKSYTELIATPKVLEPIAQRLNIEDPSELSSQITATAPAGDRLELLHLRVDVNVIAVHNIPAFVVPDENLSVNLLGMSFLSSVKWTHNNGRLVLEQ